MAGRALRALVVAVLVAALHAFPASAGTTNEREATPVTISFFWGDGCPHCEALRPFLDRLATAPGVELAAYEVWHDDANRQLFERVAAAHGIDADAVPAVFVGGRAWIGDSDAYRQAIAATVARCAAIGCTDVAGAVVQGRQPPPTPPGARPATQGTVITLPLLGSHDVGRDSLVWATSLIAFVDGFNPCSLWVLTVLLAMILRTGSRARLALIGGSYVTTVALVYGLFLVGLFGAFTVVDYAWWIRVSVAVLALALAAVNLKDYVWFGRGISLTIPDRFKPGIVRGTRSVSLADRRLPVVVAMTVGIAAGVSLLELPCTVGFPVVWTNLLAERGVATPEYAFLLAVYLLVFLVDEIAVLVAAVAAMRMGRLEQRHGRVLKLGGGMLMAVLGIVMLTDPSLLEDVGGAAVALVTAAAATVMVLIADRLVRRRAAAALQGRVPAPATARRRAGPAVPATVRPAARRGRARHRRAQP
jgi:thiol-disulfide isomerase/thioredoxin